MCFFPFPPGHIPNYLWDVPGLESTAMSPGLWFGYSRLELWAVVQGSSSALNSLLTTLHSSLCHFQSSHQALLGSFSPSPGLSGWALLHRFILNFTEFLGEQCTVRYPGPLPNTPDALPVRWKRFHTGSWNKIFPTATGKCSTTLEKYQWDSPHLQTLLGGNVGGKGGEWGKAFIYNKCFKWRI